MYVPVKPALTGDLELLQLKGESYKKADLLVFICEKRSFLERRIRKAYIFIDWPANLSISKMCFFADRRKIGKFSGEAGRYNFSLFFPELIMFANVKLSPEVLKYLLPLLLFYLKQPFFLMLTYAHLYYRYGFFVL